MTSDTMRLSVPQDRESFSDWTRHAGYRFRYAFVRAPDTRAAGQLGQDYLELEHGESRLAFALCDGVSQSFFGDVAARVLGHALIDWLCAVPPSPPDQPQLSSLLTNRLERLTLTVSDQVRDVRLPADVSPLVNGVLEQKRAIGSESMFASGVLNFATGWLTLAWLGDSRLRVWACQREQRPALPRQSERWSSVRGPLAAPHVLCTRLCRVNRVVSYTDGCAGLDESSIWLDPSLDLEELATRASLASGDDATLLEIHLD